jgi:hypothetical protein
VCGAPWMPYKTFGMSLIWEPHNAHLDLHKMEKRLEIVIVGGYYDLSELPTRMQGKGSY